MKTKLINLLILVAFISFALVGCNSGSAGNTPTAPASATNSNQEANMAAGALTSDSAGGAVLDVLTGNLEDAIVGQVGSVLWNLVTTGQAFPQTTAQWNKQALLSIESSITQIQNTLTLENQQLDVIINDINSSNVTSTGYNMYKNMLSITDGTTGVEDFLRKSITNQNQLLATESSLFGGSTQPIGSNALNAMLAYAATNNINPDASILTSTGLDTIEQQISCDTNLNVSYYTMDPAENAQNHMAPSLSGNNTCILAISLNAALNDLEQATPLTSGQNVFYPLKVFDQMLDTQYLQIISTLTQAYALDQLRLYLYNNLPSGSVSSFQIPLTVDPNNSNAAGYQASESEMLYAYNTRLTFIQGLFSQAKEAAFNQYASSIPSNSLAEKCNFSYQTPESLNY